jgi:hypothetical protein
MVGTDRLLMLNTTGCFGQGFDVNEGRMMVVSTKDIEEGAELFLHYGW